MPTLPKAILEESLKDRRLGTLVRVSLTHLTRGKLRLLKIRSERSYHDIFRVLLSIYKRHKDHFPFEAEQKGDRILNVRLTKRDCLDATNWSWMRLEDRKYFLGALAEIFFARVPFNYAFEIFREQVDRLYRAVEEVRCSNWTEFRKGLIRLTPISGSSDVCHAPRPSPSGKQRAKAK